MRVKARHLVEARHLYDLGRYQLAEDIADKGRSDFQRELTPEQREEAARGGAYH